MKRVSILFLAIFSCAAFGLTGQGVYEYSGQGHYFGNGKYGEYGVDLKVEHTEEGFSVTSTYTYDENIRSFTWTGVKGEENPHRFDVLIEGETVGAGRCYKNKVMVCSIKFEKDGFKVKETLIGRGDKLARFGTKTMVDGDERYHWLEKMQLVGDDVDLPDSGTEPVPSEPESAPL